MNFNGIDILITAGPTREMWDTIRFLSNLSSGKTGLALAKTALTYGAEVTLISSIKSHNTGGVKFIYTPSGCQMFKAVKNEFPGCDIFISAAAVCDFRPVRINNKIKKSNGVPLIKLQRNPDILKWAGEDSGKKIIIGFSLEDELDIKLARSKKKDKNCNIIVLNTTKNLGADFKTFVIITDNGVEKYENLGLEKMAEIILGECWKIIQISINGDGVLLDEN